MCYFLNSNIEDYGARFVQDMNIHSFENVIDTI